MKTIIEKIIEHSYSGTFVSQGMKLNFSYIKEHEQSNTLFISDDNAKRGPDYYIVKSITEDGKFNNVSQKTSLIKVVK
jgi:hypothetical protein